MTSELLTFSKTDKKIVGIGIPICPKFSSMLKISFTVKNIKTTDLTITLESYIPKISICLAKEMQSSIPTLSECIDKLIEIIKNTKDKDSLNNIKTKLLDLSNLVESLQKLT